MSSRFIMPFADVGSGIKPSSGAQLFFFEVDGVTPKDTYSDQLSTPTQNSNPVVSNSNGVFSDIYITGQYKVTLQDKNGSQIFGGAIVEELPAGNLDASLINDLSQAYEFPTVAAMAGSGIAFPLTKSLHVAGEGDVFANYVAVNFASDVDLGGGLWAKELTTEDAIFNAGNITENAENTKELTSSYLQFIDKPIQIAHQGGKAIAKTDTLLAFSTSLAHGFDQLELDIQITSDGVPVVFHDATIDAETNGTGLISDLTLAQVQALTFTSYAGTFLANERIPLWSDVLNFAKANGLFLWSEIKEYRSQADVLIMLQAVVDANMTQNVCLVSSTATDIQLVRTNNSDIMVGQIFASFNQPALDALAALGNAHCQISETGLTDPLTAGKFRAQGVGLSTYTILTKAKVAQLKVNSNVNMFISDGSLGGLV